MLRSEEKYSNGPIRLTPALRACKSGSETGCDWSVFSILGKELVEMSGFYILYRLKDAMRSATTSLTLLLEFDVDMRRIDVF